MDMGTQSNTLASLITRVANGDHQSLTDLSSACEALIRARVYHLVPTTDLEDDVIQLTMLRVWRKSGDFDSSRGSAIGWIAQIAHNAAIDVSRIEQRQYRNLVASMELITEPPDPSSVVDRTCHERWVDNMLDQLPFGQREALVLYYYSDLTHIEISSMTRTPLGTVKSRIRRGLINLQKLVSPDEDLSVLLALDVNRASAIST